MSKHFEEMAERMKALAEMYRVPLPAQRTEHLEFPLDPTELSADDLSRQLSFWAGMASYMQAQVSVMDAAATLAEVEHLQAYDVRYYNLHKTEKHVTDKRHLAGAYNKIRDAQLVAVRLRADCSLADALYRTYDRNYNAVNREIMRRAQERNRG